VVVSLLRQKDNQEQLRKSNREKYPEIADIIDKVRESFPKAQLVAVYDRKTGKKLKL